MATRSVQGADRLARTLGAAAADLPAITPDETARTLERDATRRAPRRTGRLAASGRVQTHRGEASVTFGNANVRYAPALNFGIGARVGQRGPHNIRATRFFSDAVAAAARTAAEDYQQPVQRVLDQVRGE